MSKSLNPPTLTLIRESWKQNPKPGNVTQRHLWKQNPDKIKIFDFGNVTQRHFWKQNPGYFYEHLLINFIFKIFWERHPASFLETKSKKKFIASYDDTCDHGRMTSSADDSISVRVCVHGMTSRV